MTFKHYLLWFEDGSSLQSDSIDDSYYDSCADGFLSVFGYKDDGFYEYNPLSDEWELVSKEA